LGGYEKLNGADPKNFKIPESDGMLDCYRNGKWFNYSNDGPTLSGSINCGTAKFFDETKGKFDSLSQATSRKRGYIEDDNGAYFALDMKSC
jgi:hypothetical protein